MSPTLPSGPDPFQGRSRHWSGLRADRVGNSADGVLANGGEVGSGAGRIDECDARRILTAAICGLFTEATKT
jgi:hypothetical protein